MAQQSFVFEATQRCNNRCLHCYNVWKGGEPYPEGELDTPATVAMLGKMLDESGAGLVTISGGEPLLRKDLGEIVDYLRGRGAALNLVTNGTLLDEPMQALVGGKISVFELPLLSSEREVHDRLSGREGCFDAVTMAIASLREAMETVVAVFVATRLNIGGFREMAELAVALGVDGIMLNRFNPGGQGFRHFAALQADMADIRRTLDVAEEVSRDCHIPISCSISMPPCLFNRTRFKHLQFGCCAAGTDRAYYTLDPLGNLRPCNHSPRILGNIRHESFQEMAESPRMRDFVNARPPFCSGCTLETECQGSCKAAGEACYGSPWEMEPFLRHFTGEAEKPRERNTPRHPRGPVSETGAEPSRW